MFSFTCSLVNTVKHLRKNNTYSLESLQKLDSERIHFNSFSDTSNTLKPKPDEDTTRKENYRPMPLVKMDAKFHNKLLAT